MFIQVSNYLGASWMGAVKLNMNLERKFVLMSTDNESDLTKPFLLCLELCKMLSWNIILQSQYWIINKTGLPLFIQVSGITKVLVLNEDIHDSFIPLFF